MEVVPLRKVQLMSRAGTCPSCGLVSPPGTTRCDCGLVLLATATDAVSRTLPGDAALARWLASDQRRVAAHSSRPNFVLGILGIISVLIGFWNLLIDPTAHVTSETVNLHKLTLGQTFTISGSILIAAQWRPR